MKEEDLVRLYQRGTAARSANREGCLTPEALLAVVEQRGSERDRTESVNHAMACPECAEELELLRSTRVVQDRARLPRNALALAASIVIVAGLGYYSLGRTRPSAAVDGGLTRGTPDVELVDPAAAPGERLPAVHWHPVEGATAYVVELRRDDGTLVTRSRTSDTTFAIADSVRAVVPGGEVYWGVIARLGDGSELRSASRRIRISP